MVTMAEIQEVADRMVEAFHPDRVILFGSYAYGTPAPDSDVDLLVIMSFQGAAVDKAVEMLSRVNPRFGVDLLVRRAEDVERRVGLGDFFLREILEKGRVLYESAHV